MTTANLSVGINTEKARADLNALKDFMRSQLSSMALSINEKSLEASINKAMKGPGGNGYSLKINLSELKTNVSKVLNEAASGVKVSAGSIDETKILAALKKIDGVITTSLAEAGQEGGKRLTKAVTDDFGNLVNVSSRAGKASGKAFADGVESEAKKAKISYRFKEGAGAVGASLPTSYTAEQVKARAEQAKADADSRSALLKRIDLMRTEFELRKKTSAEELKAFLSSEAKAGTAEMKARAQGWANIAAEAAKAEKAQRAAAARMFAEGKNLAPDNLTAKGKAQYGAQYAVSRGVSELMLPNGAAGLLQATDGLEKGIKKVGAAHTEATGKTKAHTAAMHDAHSAARGLASGMGMMWLTWGNIAPLLAGASLSHGFIQAMKAGSEFAYQLTFVKALGGETSEAVRGIGEAALQMSKNGLYGPVELANGLRVLNQAGISTKDSMMALPQVFDLATVGEMSMADAAITLAGVMTAFNLQVKDMSHIGDVFAKAAAESQTSVEQMTQAMRMASVVGEQYGASMEDTATALTLLAKMNITGTAAGTSLRNMLKEIYTPTDKAAKMLKDLGVSAQTATGDLKPFPEIIFAMKGKLEEFNKASQAKILQGIFGERGAKEAIAMLSQTREQWDKLNKTVSESEGFMAKASAALEATTKGSFKQAVNTLQANLIEAFNSSEGAAGKLAAQLKNTFDSPAFKASLNAITTGMLGLTNALVAMAPALAAVAAGWVLLRGAILVGSVWTSVATAVAGVTATFVTAAAASTGLASGLAGLKAVLLSLMGPFGWIATAIAGVTVALGYMYSKMSEHTAANSLAERTSNLAQVMENLKNKTAAATRELLRQEAVKKGATEAGGFAGEVKEAQGELARLRGEKSDLYQKKIDGTLSISERLRLGTLEKKIVESDKNLQKVLGDQRQTDINEREYNANRLRIAISDAKDSLAGIDDKKATPQQKKAISAARERLETLSTNSEGILKGANGYFVEKLEQELAKQVQDAKIATGTKNLVESGGGGGRADREAAKLENANVLAIEKRYQAELRTADAHYARLEKIENTSAQYGIKTKEGAEAEISRLTEEHWTKRLDMVSTMSDEMSALLGKSVKLSDADRTKAKTFVETAQEEINTLKEKISWIKKEAELKSEGANLKFGKDLDKNAVDLTKELELAKASAYGKAKNPIERARDNGETLVSNRYAQMMQEAVDARIRAEESGNEASIKAAAERLDLLDKEVQAAKAYYGDQYAALAEYQQTGTYGWNKFWENYQEQGTTAAKVVEQSMESVTKNLEDAFSKAFETGKFDAQAMFKAIMGDMGKLTAKMAVSDLGNLLFKKGQSSSETLGMGKTNDSFNGVLNPVVDSLKKFWGSLTGATGATEDATAKTAEGIVKMVTKTSAESTATTSMMQLASAAQMAASHLAMMGGGSSGSGGGLLSSILGSTSKGGSSFLPFNANAPLPGAADFVGPMMGASSAASSGALDFMSMIFAANGAAFNSRSLQAFAKGGTFSNSIVNSPTLFRFANGTGLMGEAGPEAIMPLTRDGQGRLGVRYEGREAPQSRGNSNVSNNNINVTVNSKTGDPAEIRRSGAAVARQVANAVAGSGRYR